MTEPRTPSTDEVRSDYCAAWSEDADLDREAWAEREREFNRWLRAQLAQAWREGAACPNPEYAANPYEFGV